VQTETAAVFGEVEENIVKLRWFVCHG
jgi:hypothetical protein